MLFNSLQYAVFLPVVFLLFWLSPQSWRVPILLIASYVFYMAWQPPFILLVVALTVVNFFVGRTIASATEDRRRQWLFVGVLLNLACLSFFKYTYFGARVINACLKPFGAQLLPIPLDIILPLGISFYIFEFVHYLVDVHRGSEPVRSFMNFALFASFFPTQIAGPIKRYQSFVPQLSTSSTLKSEYLDEGMSLILFGLFKKIIVADNLAVLVAAGFEQPALFNGLDLWIFAYTITFQIYFDFSGYTDIARGSAKLFGLEVPINFNFPLLAGSISEFWQRWHISLCKWLGDYVFYPLRYILPEKGLAYSATFIVFAVSGLWHGAGAHFVVWGMFHGIMLIAHKIFQRRSWQYPKLRQALASRLGHWLSVLLTFHVVCVSMVIFRATSLGAALFILRRMFLLDHLPHTTVTEMILPTINYPSIFRLIYLILPLLALSQVLGSIFCKRQLLQRTPFPIKAVCAAAAIILLLIGAPDNGSRFVYFQF